MAKNDKPHKVEDLASKVGVEASLLGKLASTMEISD